MDPLHAARPRSSSGVAAVPMNGARAAVDRHGDGTMGWGAAVKERPEAGFCWTSDAVLFVVVPDGYLGTDECVPAGCCCCCCCCGLLLSLNCLLAGPDWGHVRTRLGHIMTLPEIFYPHLTLCSAALPLLSSLETEDRLLSCMMHAPLRLIVIKDLFTN